MSSIYRKLTLFLFIICLHTLHPCITLAHEGVTPFDVLTNMRRKGAGPYASPGYKDSLTHNWLGISAQDVISGEQSIGVLIIKVHPDSPAEQGDLEPGDVIIRVNDSSIRSVDDLELLMSKISQPGEHKFSLLRDGEEESEEVYLEANLREMDPEMHKLLMEKRGRFEPGMLQEDIMRKMFDSRKVGPPGQNEADDAASQPFTPGKMMQQMLERSPMGHMGTEQTDPTLGHEATPLLPLGQTGRDRLAAYLADQLTGYLKYSNQLQLSPTQLDRLSKLDSTYRKHLVAQEAESKLAELELEEALSKEKIDLDQTTQLTDKLTKLRQEDQQRQVEFLKELQQIITTEQQTKYQQLLR